MPDAPRRRPDATALAAAVTVAACTLAAATHPNFTGLAPVFGPAVDAGTARVAACAGFASFVGLVGAAAVVAEYVAGSTLWRMMKRAAGWAVLTVAAAVAADAAAANIPRAGTPFGPGGAGGAFLRISLDGVLAKPALVAVVGLSLALGVWLAADGLVRRLYAAGAAVLGRIPRPRMPVRTPKPEPVVVPEPVPVPISVPEPIAVSVETPPPVPELRIVRVPDPEPEEEPAPEPPPPDYELPPLALLTDPDPHPEADHATALRDRAALLERTFADFGLNVKVVGIHTGPVITQYEVALETGLRLSKVTVLADDLALNLRVPAVRVVAPLPGRNTVGIEVPNEHRQVVRLKELIAGTAAKAAKYKLPVFLGKDVEGRPLVYDLASMPHLLIAGRTGTGKSVCLNTIILSLLYTRRPTDCRMIMIDPKKVELSEYGKVPHLMHPVVTDDRKAEAILAWAVDKMEERYEWLRRARVRNIASYNDLPFEDAVRRIDPASEEERRQVPRAMPYIVIIIDEVGDLIMSMKKEVESHIIRLAQKSRAAGIHLILATQKPTVDVVTGLIKSNLPARICFQVASRADSMVVLDEKGADKLLGMGDMLFLQPGTSSILRAQGAYVSDSEIEKTVAHLETDEPNYESELLNLKAKDAGGAGGGLGEKLRERDALYEQAVEIVIREQRGSTSLLQRSLGVGYGRASRLIDFMAEDGIVGGFNGSNARDVLVTTEDWETRRQAAG